MTKHGILMRSDFYKLNKIKEVRAEENGSDLIVAYLFLLQYADDDEYILDDDIPEIAEDLEYDENKLRGLINNLFDVELAEQDIGGFWLLNVADLE